MAGRFFFLSRLLSNTEWISRVATVVVDSAPDASMQSAGLVHVFKVRVLY